MLFILGLYVLGILWGYSLDTVYSPLLQFSAGVLVYVMCELAPKTGNKMFFFSKHFLLAGLLLIITAFALPARYVANIYIISGVCCFVLGSLKWYKRNKQVNY